MCARRGLCWALAAIQAYRILNDFVGDLVAGTRSLEVFESLGLPQGLGPTLSWFYGGCAFPTSVTLSKWAELYDRYKAVISHETREACLEPRKEIERRGVRDFRNTVVGHIWDSKLKRPLMRAEVDARLAQVRGDSQQSFLAWINDPAANVSRKTVVAICEATRGRIRAEHDLNDSEIFTQSPRLAP